MMVHIELQLALPEQIRPQSGWGYALYGALCAAVPPAVVRQWHAQAITPVRQDLRASGPGQALWCVDVCGPEAPQVQAALQNLTHISLNAVDRPLPVLGFKSQTIHLDALPPPSLRVRLEMLTPMGFKSNGAYQQYPTAELILKSLAVRQNVFFAEQPLPDAALDALLAAPPRIESYRLESRSFPLKGHTILAFQGVLTLKATLPPQLLPAWQQLFAAATYCGIGIKPALGMGAVQIQYR